MSRHDNDVIILSAARSPIGKFQGALSGIPAPQLGAVAIKAAIEHAGIDPTLLAEVIMGNVVPAGEGQAPARQAAIAAGVPASVGVSSASASTTESVTMTSSRSASSSSASVFGLAPCGAEVAPDAVAQHRAFPT